MQPGQTFGLSGSDVWGRVNPDFCGFPTVSIATDVVILQRSTPAGQTILFDGIGNPLLDASDLGAATDAGFRLNVTFFDHCDWDFMFDMLFMGEMFSRQSVDPSGGVNLFFYQGVAVDPVDTATFRSDLDTGEFNVRRRFGPYVACSAACVILELSEHLDFNDSGQRRLHVAIGQSVDRWPAGAEAVAPLGGYGRLFAVGKYGIYNNRFEVAAQASVLNPSSAVHSTVRNVVTCGIAACRVNVSATALRTPDTTCSSPGRSSVPDAAAARTSSAVVRPSTPLPATAPTPPRGPAPAAAPQASTSRPPQAAGGAQRGARPHPLTPATPDLPRTTRRETGPTPPRSPSRRRPRRTSRTPPPRRRPARLGMKRHDHTGERRRDLDHGLRGLHLGDRLVQVHGVALGDEPRDDLGLGQALTADPAAGRRARPSVRHRPSRARRRCARRSAGSAARARPAGTARPTP